MIKSEIRLLYRQKRSGLIPNVVDNYSKSIASILTSSFDFTHKTVSIFLPIKDKTEVNTWFIVDKLQALDSIIGLPKVDFTNNQLIHFAYENLEQLDINRFGISEPKYGKLLQPNNFDFVIVPLLAITKNGQRVGYGKGFYDNFLRKCSTNCIFIGLHFFDEFVAIDDIWEEDVSLHFCVNPSRIISFEK